MADQGCIVPAGEVDAVDEEDGDTPHRLGRRRRGARPEGHERTHERTAGQSETTRDASELARPRGPRYEMPQQMP